jgi:hypothetical protein
VTVRRALPAALALFVTLVAGAPAHAFVRSTTMGGNSPLFWKESCVPVTIYLNGFIEKTKLSKEGVIKSIAASAQAWGPDDVTCGAGGTEHPSLEIVPTLALADTPGPTGYDARNSLIFRTDNWTMGGKIDGKAYSDSALAVTTVIARMDGHIVDADMEINAVNNSRAWVNLDPGVQVDFAHDTRDFFDLQNTITHEFGHLIGLDHTCFTFDPMMPKLRPADDMGNPVPDCGGAGAGLVADTTMYDTAMSLETSKRTLAFDDMRAVCTIYPPGVPREACTLDSPVGCTIAAAPVVPRPASGRPWAPLAAAGLLAVGVVVRARRRARR